LLKVALSIVSIFIILLLIPTVNDFILILLRPAEFSLREYFWNSGIEMFRDNFFSGVGPEMFASKFYNYLPSDGFTLFENIGAMAYGKIHSPHNYFLSMAAENGIFGLLTAAAIFILFFYLAFKAIKMAQHIDTDYYIISVAIAGIGIGLFIRAFFEINGILYYGYISRDLPFWIIFIILIYIYKDLRVKSKNISRLQLSR
jgi:O-antigen ligase